MPVGTKQDVLLYGAQMSSRHITSISPSPQFPLPCFWPWSQSSRRHDDLGTDLWSGDAGRRSGVSTVRRQRETINQWVDSKKPPFVLKQLLPTVLAWHSMSSSHRSNRDADTLRLEKLHKSFWPIRSKLAHLSLTTHLVSHDSEPSTVVWDWEMKDKGEI